MIKIHCDSCGSMELEEKGDMQYISLLISKMIFT